MSIKVENISKSYGKQKILRNVSFELEEGTCSCITGRNGCGKTTLLSILMGVEKADSGRVLWPARNYSIGYLPQINPLMEDMSVLDNLKLWADNKEYMLDALTRFELSEIKGKRVSKLSGGMKRRLAIACALVNKPRLLVMDEPTAALDIVYKKIIHDEMIRFMNEGGTIVMVTHEKEEIDMCHKVMVLENGVIA